MLTIRFVVSMGQREYMARKKEQRRRWSSNWKRAWLIWQGGFDWQSRWLLVTYALYLVVGSCWIPVVWIQIELRRMVRVAHEAGAPLSTRYDKLFRRWFLLGWPAFAGLVAVFYMMVAKPA